MELLSVLLAADVTGYGIAALAAGVAVGEFVILEIDRS